MGRRGLLFIAGCRFDGLPSLVCLITEIALDYRCGHGSDVGGKKEHAKSRSGIQ